jgi:hypothetical protein
MTVVINLDAFWHARQTERVRQSFEQTRLGRGVGEFAARASRALVSAWLPVLLPRESRDLDLVPGFHGQASDSNS